jgi:hypothetical protein
VKRASVGFPIALLLLTAAAADAGSQHRQAAGAAARAYAIRVVVPGQTGAETPTVTAPNDQVQFSGSFTYGTGPDGKPIVSSGSANASASAHAGTNASATASTEIDSLSLFSGEITATSVVAQAHAEARAGAARGNITGSTVTDLVALGQKVTGATSISLADWGSLTTVSGGASGSPATGYRGSVTALEIRLTADHGGLPAGTTILVGYAEVAAQAAPPEPSVQTPLQPKAKGASKQQAPEPTPGV